MPRKGKTKKPSELDFVLDGSLALAWYFKEEVVSDADAVAASFVKARALVPAIWPLEIANAVLMGERRKRSTEAQAAKWFSYLSALPIIIDETTSDHAWTEALPLGAGTPPLRIRCFILGSGSAAWAATGEPR